MMDIRDMEKEAARLAAVRKLRGDWMQTFTGRQYWPRDPRAEDVDIVDIAAALSKQTRYGGHCLRFYSVAEHCVLMARAAEARGEPISICFTALMHDASEAYLVDVPRPIKSDLGGYFDIENANMKEIAKRYGFEFPLPAVVKMLDNQILLDEQAQNMASPPVAWGIPGEPLGVTLQFWTPEQARGEFLSAFYYFGTVAGAS